MPVSYKLIEHMIMRGFQLRRGSHRIFETRHKYGFLPSSSVSLNNETIVISHKNFVGDRLSISKDKKICGEIDFSYYKYATIELEKSAGGLDNFRLDAIDYSQEYLLHRHGTSPIFKISKLLNPAHLTDKYTVEVFDVSLPHTAIEELLLYAGEIIFRDPQK